MKDIHFVKNKKIKGKDKAQTGILQPKTPTKDS